MSLKENKLSDKQKEMLEMLGINVPKNIDKKDLKDVAVSKSAMKLLEDSRIEVRNNMEKDNQKLGIEECK